jgi:hypothetical protein
MLRGMKTLVVSLVMAVVLPAEPAAVAGKWQIKRTGSGRESVVECTIAEAGGVLSGACVSDRGKAELKGKVEGEKVTWTTRAESEGGPVTLVYTGKVSGPGKMAGSVLAVEFGVEGEFAGVLMK